MFWEQMSFSSQTKLQTSPNPNIPNRMTIMWVLMYLSPKELGWLFFAINKSHQWPTGATNYWCPVLYLKSNTINHLCILTASIGQGRRNPHPRLFWTDIVLKLMWKQDKEKCLSTDAGLPKSWLLSVCSAQRRSQRPCSHLQCCSDMLWC